MVWRRKVKQSAEQRASVDQVWLAQAQGLSLTGLEGLLKQLTKTVLETALHEELTEHPGYEKDGRPDAGPSNIGNGTRAKPERSSPENTQSTGLDDFSSKSNGA